MTRQATVFSEKLNASVIRNIGVLAFPGVEIIDVTGPFEVFGMASLMLQQQQRGHDFSEPAYRIDVIAESRGPVKTLTGLEVVATKAFDEIDAGLHTLIIPGTPFLDKVLADTKLLTWIRKMAPKVQRLVSVCTGAFVLAECGLLNHLRATTHWNWCEQFTQTYPQVVLEPNKIFIRAGRIYTSGGVTSGIDLSLALIEDDWGREMALSVARFLVVYVKRPGGQAQFSAYLASEPCGRQSFKELQTWIIENPGQDLQVDALAKRMAMSPRNFARTFLSETGMTPAKFVEHVRIDTARQFLEKQELTIEQIAVKAGFYDAERMRRAFIRILGVNPKDYRERFGLVRE